MTKLEHAVEQLHSTWDARARRKAAPDELPPKAEKPGRLDLGSSVEARLQAAVLDVALLVEAMVADADRLPEGEADVAALAKNLSELAKTMRQLKSNLPSRMLA